MDYLKRAWRFSRSYAALGALLFTTEAFIALKLHDSFVRPLLGDTLAVVFVYAVLLSAFELPRVAVALGAFAIACGFELAQYVHMLDRLGIADVTLARIVFGWRYDPRDFLAYAAALPLIAIAEYAAGLRARRFA